MRQPRQLTAVFVIALVWIAAPAVRASQASSAQAQTATQVYLAYRAAIDKAKSLEDLAPYLSKARQAYKMMDLDMIKDVEGEMQNPKVTSEDRTDTAAALTVEAISKTDKKPVKFAVRMVREDGAWKVDKENFSPLK